MILITGASNGLGRYLFEHFIKERVDVLGTYHKSLPDQNEYSQFLSKVDVSDYQSVEKWIATIKDQCQDLVLLNCAGISYNAFAHKSNIQRWSDVIAVNLMGTFHVIHQVLPIMRAQNYGRIINFSSIVTSLPMVGTSAYCASKAGLLGLTKTLAKENASKGITVNAIKLGYVNIGMGLNEVPKEVQESLLKDIPMGCFCDPSEVCRTVNYIIQTSYLNGAAIDLNGGLI